MSPGSAQPVPQGNYLPAVRHGDLIYTSGMTPRENGLLLYAGKIRADAPVTASAEAVRLSARNALTALRALLGKEEKISAILQLTVYLNTEEGFTRHPEVADFASAFLAEELGSLAIGSRAAVGVATLPSDAMVEIALVAAVGRRESSIAT